MDNQLNLFFTKTYENDINFRMFENDYYFPANDVINYIRKLNEISVDEYVQWLNEHFCTTILSTEDAVQYSNFEDATKRVVEVIMEAGNKGFTHLEIGKLLQNDGVSRNDGAYTKYGENHAKTATYLGYLFSIKRFYYVSAIGYVLSKLSVEEQEKLFVRLLLRTNLFKTVFYLVKNGNVSMRDIFDMLSEKTYIRRKNNIYYFFQKLKNEKSCIKILESITY